MQPNSVIKSARGRWLAGAAVIAGTMLVSACGSSHPTPTASASASASPASPAAAAAPSAPATTAVAPAPASPAATPTATVNPGGPVASTESCAYKRDHDRFMQISQVQQNSNGSLTIHGYAEVIVCGGPDDFHFSTTAPEMGQTVPDASIVTFPVTQMKPEPIKPSQLASYLKTDGDTKIFLVGGSIYSITSLQEQYHP
ncbi:MAG TPA: hypothetical protein VIZ20_04780 [Streptosporangiaceae bacterium]